jgi:hypothetical protein
MVVFVVLSAARAPMISRGEDMGYVLIGFELLIGVALALLALWLALLVLLSLRELYIPRRRIKFVLIVGILFGLAYFLWPEWRPRQDASPEPAATTTHRDVLPKPAVTPAQAPIPTPSHPVMRIVPVVGMPKP